MAIGSGRRSINARTVEHNKMAGLMATLNHVIYSVTTASSYILKAGNWLFAIVQWKISDLATFIKTIPYHTTLYFPAF